MEHEEIHDAATFIAGLTIGALIGTVSAILLAPQSGKRTRRRIARKAGEWSETAAEKVGEVRDETSRIADRTRRDARRIARDARRRVDETGERLTEAVEHGRDRLRS
ncbi:MAG: YtxH domain-containing protein [Gemmatimonadota bacterium]|nr:YtxH domain-containing protein [Gemmatimonadota bacterium]MDH3428256.1 YtxH domain-containing protein [Gemmatimonadota bacterium]